MEATKAPGHRTTAPSVHYQKKNQKRAQDQQQDREAKRVRRESMDKIPGAATYACYRQVHDVECMRVKPRVCWPCTPQGRGTAGAAAQPSDRLVPLAGHKCPRKAG